MSGFRNKSFAICALRRSDGERAPVYGVPTGSRLEWTIRTNLDAPDAFADVRLRRGNELIELVGPMKLSDISGGTTGDLPGLSPGRYELELTGYTISADGRRVHVAADEWPFFVGEPGSGVKRADEVAESYDLAI